MFAPPRLVTLVLVTSDGRIVGALPPMPVEVPWWQEAEPVVRAAREQHGVEVTVLRLLEAERPQPHGGPVTYVAEVNEPVAAARPWPGELDDQPLRASWARPGGPAEHLAWADARLDDLGLRRIAPAVQVRAWNLSSLWRLPVADQTVWLKVVPPFFAHEGDVLERLAGGPVPTLLAHDGPRLLMAEIPGVDLYDAGGSQLRSMVSLLVTLQRPWIGRVDELLSTGMPDWRGPALIPRIAEVVERTASELDPDQRAALARFVDGLPERLAAIDACGLPDTLVHGDFHPGNTRGVDEAITLLDWGDSSVGHPLLDQPAFLDRVPATEVEAVRRHWCDAWEVAVPGSRPARAETLLAPVATARLAVIYRMFLDGIEPSERPYHAADPAEQLRRTAALVAGAEARGAS